MKDKYKMIESTRIIFNEIADKDSYRHTKMASVHLDLVLIAVDFSLN